MRLLATLGVLGLASGLWAAEKMDLAKGRQHWAFQPVQRAALPAVKAKDWPQNGIDHFILARLEKAGLQPAPAVAPRDCSGVSTTHSPVFRRRQIQNS